jgi:hypothetical protein
LPLKIKFLKKIKKRRKKRIVIVKLKPFQTKFFNSKVRFPAMVAGIGTGKTYMLLLKIWRFCEEYPQSLALIARKEYTDLRDSTLKDFERYFNVTVDSNKEYSFPNGSKIMFRHAAELNVLKNINLSIAGIEQAEEFENDDQFTFIRDRLRRDNAPYQQLCIVANANGHNWIWKLWKDNPSTDYSISTATTFDNSDNLPETFLKDMRQMEIDSPNHYLQFVMNSFEETGADDRLLIARHVYESSKLIFPYFGSQGRILAVDVARFGEDETVFCAIEKVSDVHFIQIHQETWREKSLMETTGKILDLKKILKIDVIVVDDIGLGGGVTDRLKEMKYKVQPFIGNEAPLNPIYFNKRSEGFFLLKEVIDSHRLKIIDDSELAEQLLSVRYKFKSNGEKAIVSKDEMRKLGLKSPDRADALMMACFYKDAITRTGVFGGSGKVEFSQQGQTEYKEL